MQKEYFYIYIVTNKINGKQYIGKHKTKNLEDGYLGSGNLIKRAIKKYGKQNFNKEILCFCCNNEELNEKEKYYIKKYNADKSENFYNISKGGDGGDIFSCLPEAQKQQLILKMKEKSSGEKNPMYGVKRSDEYKRRMSE